MIPNNVQFTIQDKIGYAFSEFFGIIYPFVHTHFVSYALILILASGITWYAYKQFRKTKATGSKVFWAIIGIIIGSFSLWLLLIHFQTFMNADLYFEQ